MIKYKDAGVDVEAGYEAVRLMHSHVKKTFRPEVLTDLGGFGGLFGLDVNKYKKPVLVSGTDGVGTKLKIAFLMDKHDTVGIDCVAMCVNDIVCSGAEPLFFLDYIATGKNIPSKVAEIVKGVAEGCIMSGCSLIGGETAEMPGFYPEDEYDIAGFAVGIVDRDEIIDGKNMKSGDKLIGIASSGVHSNGFSLIRKLLNPNRDRLLQYIDTLGDVLGQELLKPTRIYVKDILTLRQNVCINGISHITGGGFIENVPRMIKPGLKARILKDTWPLLPVFELLRKLGELDDKEMYNTFNMGIGMIICVPAGQADKTVELLNRDTKQAYVIGELIDNEILTEAGIEIC